MLSDRNEKPHRNEVPAGTLVKPLSNSWRNRILIELHVRPMSPKQFSKEFPGPTPSTISRYFRELKDWGFIEIAEKRRKGTRRGAAEKVYRAIRRVHFDTPHWEALPQYLREECTGVIVEGLLLRLKEAFEAGTFDLERSRHRSCELVPLDHQAWTALTDELDRLLYWLNELEAESLARHKQNDEELLAATVSLLTFRSPTQMLEQDDALLEASNHGSLGPHFLMAPQTAKALANPWRNRILEELHKRPMSPMQFSEESEEPDLAAIGRCFRQLRDWGYIELLEEKQGSRHRGAIEKVYRAVPRKTFNLSDWHEVPPMSKDGESGALIDELVCRLDEAVAAKTMDLDTDRHLSWMSLELDRRAWDEFTTRLKHVATWVGELTRESAERAGGRGLIPATVALLAFRSPDPAAGA